MISPKTRIIAVTCALLVLLVAAPARAQKAATEEPYARFWGGISAGLDVAFMPSGNDLCRLNPDGTIMNSVHAFCTDPAGRDFPVRGNQYQNDLMPEGGAGSLDGGPVLGNFRLLLSLDYAVTPFLLVGARGGYVGNSYPGTAGLGGRAEVTRHLHGELRVTYLLGDAPLSRVGFAPLAFLAFGAGQYDGGKASTIHYKPPITAAEDVIIWVVSGPWFASLGAGARYQFSARAAFTAAVRGNVSFGPLGSLLTMGPEIAFLYGF
jgi:hypothetical protein